MKEEHQVGEFFENLKALSNAAFPKRCANCGLVYQSLADFVARTEQIAGQSGLKRGYDDDDQPIVHLFRNCACGSTLMDFFGDRRDGSQTGLQRRALFDKLIDGLNQEGLSVADARRELLKVTRGESSAVLCQMGLSMDYSNKGGIENMDRCRDIATGLRKGGNETVSFFESLAPEQLETRVYQDGAHWTARQVLAHFITIERSMHRLFENMLAGGEGAPPDFDLERYNLRQTQKMDGLDLQALISQFRVVRQETIAMVEKMSEADLDRQGRHPFHGTGKLDRFIRWAYEHARIHEAEIRKAIQ